MAKSTAKRLRGGFTTGAAAAAAAKAALMTLLDGRPPEKVTVDLLSGRRIDIALYNCRVLEPGSVQCSVIKDAGDDPDVTNRAEIGARVRFRADKTGQEIEIIGGEGVGQVTKPGLAIEPGLPAITRGPQRMISQEIENLLKSHRQRGRVSVEVFVPKGRQLAKKTLNARLGILGGISILGTTGEVRPLSHAAYIATIDAALSVAKAGGTNRVVLTTGRRSERFAQALWPALAEEAFIQIGDYFAESLGRVAAKGIAGATLAVFFGKGVKMAQAIAHTHARSASLTLAQLARWTLEITGNDSLSRQVADANTARQAFDLVKADHPAVIRRVGQGIVSAAEGFSHGKVAIRVVIFDFDGRVTFDSEQQE